MSEAVGHKPSEILLKRTHQNSLLPQVAFPIAVATTACAAFVVSRGSTLTRIFAASTLIHMASDAPFAWAVRAETPFTPKFKAIKEERIWPWVFQCSAIFGLLFSGLVTAAAAYRKNTNPLTARQIIPFVVAASALQVLIKTILYKISNETQATKEWSPEANSNTTSDRIQRSMGVGQVFTTLSAFAISGLILAGRIKQLSIRQASPL